MFCSVCIKYCVRVKHSLLNIRFSRGVSEALSCATAHFLFLLLTSCFSLTLIHEHKPSRTHTQGLSWFVCKSCFSFSADDDGDY